MVGGGDRDRVGKKGPGTGSLALNGTMPDCFADRPRNNSEEMQRCPYLHEMKERLLSQPTPTDSLDMERLDGTPVKEPNLHNDYPAHTNPGVIPDPPEMPPDSLIGTVVKVRPPFRFLRSPARSPLLPSIPSLLAIDRAAR